MSTFIDKFTFHDYGFLPLGAEEEYWTQRQDGSLFGASMHIFGPPKHCILVGETPEGKPGAKLFPELPVHQIEGVTGVCADAHELRSQLERNRTVLNQIARQHSFKVCYCPMPPSDFSVTVYCKPRYLQIYESIPSETLQHAWIAGLHIHVGVRNWDEAIKLFNGLRSQLSTLVVMGANSPGQGVSSRRFFTYETLMEKLEGQLSPPALDGPEHLESLAQEQGFYKDPKKCWWVMRINPIGTVEIRLFDMQLKAQHSAEIAAAVRVLAARILNEQAITGSLTTPALHQLLRSSAQRANKACLPSKVLDSLAADASFYDMPEEAALIRTMGLRFRDHRTPIGL